MPRGEVKERVSAEGLLSMLEPADRAEIEAMPAGGGVGQRVSKWRTLVDQFLASDQDSAVIRATDQVSVQAITSGLRNVQTSHKKATAEANGDDGEYLPFSWKASNQKQIVGLLKDEA